MSNVRRIRRSLSSSRVRRLLLQFTHDPRIENGGNLRISIESRSDGANGAESSECDRSGLHSLIVCNEQNTQFDSVEAFQSCVTRLFYRTLLQVIICDSFPTEFP